MPLDRLSCVSHLCGCRLLQGMLSAASGRTHPGGLAGELFWLSYQRGLSSLMRCRSAAQIRSSSD